MGADNGPQPLLYPFAHEKVITKLLEALTIQKLHRPLALLHILRSRSAGALCLLLPIRGIDVQLNEFWEPECQELFHDADLIIHVALLQVKLVWRIWILQTRPELLHSEGVLPSRLALLFVVILARRTILLSCESLLDDLPDLEEVNWWLLLAFPRAAGGCCRVRLIL